MIMTAVWKKTWNDTQERFVKWWNHQGLVVASWGPVQGTSDRLGLPKPPTPETIEDSYLDTAMRIERNHYQMSRSDFPLDTLPRPNTDFGPGTLSTFLGAEPHITRETVWFEPTMESVLTPEELPPFAFDANNRWFRHMSDFLAGSVARADGAYMIGLPDLIENIDTLAVLRGNETLMMDMVERPDWVLQKLDEINQVYFDAYDALYQIVKDGNGGSMFCAFGLWGPGRTAKVQCDASAMFSPAMFRQFVVPALTEQCEWLDYSMYHLDGKEEFCHQKNSYGHSKKRDHCYRFGRQRPNKKRTSWNRPRTDGKFKASM